VILTVTPNAAVDKTYRVEDFRLDWVNRPSEEHTVAGGKGVNVARVYRTLGGEAVATGFLGGIQGRLLARALAQEGMPDAFVRVRGETRLCIAVIDPNHGTQTEINERGPVVSARACRKLCDRVATLLSQKPFDFVVLSGRLPPGAPDSLYAELTEVARRRETRVVLDTSGAALKAGLRARPFMVKPNRVELESVLGRPITDRADVRRAAEALIASGIALVAVTLGAEGAMLFTAEGAWRATPPPIAFASAVASGDSFVAAFLWEWLHGRCPGDPVSALRLATGAGAANAAVIGAGFCTRESIFDMAQRAEIIDE
jgi:1-phosphofructokinase family hexose kinase